MRRNIGKNLIALFSVVLIVVLHVGRAHAQSVFFDDFNYTSSSDPTMLNFGWAPRSGGGGPGIGTWDPTHITFIPDPADSTNELMQMAATTSGTASTTIQTEILTPIQFLHGTFAARVKFADAPQTGPDGDQLYQTFFTISAYKSRPYSEIDFEYLPNGYGSVTTPHFFFTLWQTTHKNVSTNIAASYAGWHTLLVDDADGVDTHFYVDGVLVYTASVYYPTALMAIDFNQWFPTGSLVNSSTPRTWVEQIDWVYHAKDTLLTTAQVESNVASYRNQGIVRLNTVF
ncbi:MAG TPA: glycoside hydrolase family 16 protein [Terriglobales bacterium]